MKSRARLSKSGPYSLPRGTSPLGRVHNPANRNIPREFRPRRRDFDLPRVPYRRSINNYRNLKYLISQGVRIPFRFNPYSLPFEILGTNPWAWYNPVPMVGGDYSYKGPGLFRICPTDRNFNNNTFYVDAGEVLGSALTCLAGQAIFDQNFEDAPELHRNLWLMRSYQIVPGLDRSASLWVRHVPEGLPAPYPVPEPMPYALPSAAPLPWVEPYPWNPFVPESAPLGGVAPDPMPLPWRRAVGNRTRNNPSEGFYGEPGQLPGGAPSGRPGASAGGKTAPPARPPSAGTKEGKVDVGVRRWLMAASKLLGGLTETKDFLEALWGALPAEVRARYRGNIAGMAQAIYENFGAIDLKKAIRNWALNKLEDAVVGRMHQAAQRGMKSARNRGYWNGLDVRKRLSPGVQ